MCARSGPGLCMGIMGRAVWGCVVAACSWGQCQDVDHLLRDGGIHTRRGDAGHAAVCDARQVRHQQRPRQRGTKPVYVCICIEMRLLPTRQEAMSTESHAMFHQFRRQLTNLKIHAPDQAQLLHPIAKIPRRYISSSSSEHSSGLCASI